MSLQIFPSAHLKAGPWATVTYPIMCFFWLFLVYRFLPETKGLTVRVKSASKGRVIQIAGCGHQPPLGAQNWYSRRWEGGDSSWDEQRKEQQSMSVRLSFSHFWSSCRVFYLKNVAFYYVSVSCSQISNEEELLHKAFYIVRGACHVNIYLA